MKFVTSSLDVAHRNRSGVSRRGGFGNRALDCLRDTIMRIPLTAVGLFEYHNDLESDAPHGCHHRGDHPI
jgi:hypothetical protein